MSEPGNTQTRPVTRPESLGGLLGFIARRRYILLSVMILSVAATAAVVYRLEPQYQAELKLFITRARVQAPLNAESMPAASSVPDITEAEITSEIELLRSRALMEETMKARGMAKGGNRQEFERALKRFAKDLQVTPVRRTSLISVKYTSPDPQQAAGVPNTIADLYLNKHMEIHGARQSSQFFSEQAGVYHQELMEAQEKLDEFEQQNGAGLLSEQKQANLKRVAEIESALQETQVQARDAERRVSLLEVQLGQLPETVNAQSRRARNHGLLERWKGQLLELELKRAQLLTNYAPGYRLVDEIERQIQGTRQALERELSEMVVDETDALNPIRQGVESELLRTQAQLAGLRARESALSQELQSQSDRQRALAAMTTQHGNLERQHKIAESSYLLYEKKREEARIAEAMDREGILNVSVVERAVVPALAAGGHRLFVAMLGLIGGLLLSAGAAMGAEALDPRVLSREDLEEAANLPVVIDLAHEEASRSWS